MIYDRAKDVAQRLANQFGTEMGVRHTADDQYEYAEAAWYAVVHKQEGWSLDDIELVLPAGSDETTWPEVVKAQDDYDPTPTGAEE